MNHCAKCLKSESDCKCPNQWHSVVSAEVVTIDELLAQRDQLKAELAAARHNEENYKQQAEHFKEQYLSEYGECEKLENSLRNANAELALATADPESLQYKNVVMARTIAVMHDELAAAREAIGLMTTAKPSMVMRSNDPVGMAQEVVAELAKLRALCAGAAEQFNRCYDPAMVGRLAAAGRGEG